MTDHDHPEHNPDLSHTATGDPDGTIEQLIDAVNLHTELLREMADQVKTLQSGESKTGKGGWTAYGSDQARLDSRVMALRDWLRWAHPVLFEPNLPDPFPACWSSHPGVVEELLALHAAWVNAYAGDPSEAMIAWHDRWLRPSLDRMWQYGLNSCSRNGTHQDRTLRPINDDGDMVAAITPTENAPSQAQQRIAS